MNRPVVVSVCRLYKTFHRLSSSLLLMANMSTLLPPLYPSLLTSTTPPLLFSDWLVLPHPSFSSRRRYLYLTAFNPIYFIARVHPCAPGAGLLLLLRSGSISARS